MSFIKQYDRLFVATFGLVNLIRGGGGIIELLLMTILTKGDPLILHP